MIRLPRLRPLLVAAATSVAVTGLVLVLDHLEQSRYRHEARSDVLNRLSTIRARLETALNSRIYLARGLMIHVATHPNISRDEFDQLAKWLVGSQNGILALQLAKDTRISHIYPMKGNEKALGFSILDQPDQAPAARRAIRNRTAVFAGPVKLVQGGTAFITRQPVFLTPPGGKPGSGAYWGLAQVLIDQESLFREAALVDATADLALSLRGKDGLGAAGSVFWGDPQVYDTDPVRLDVNLPYGNWELAATPKGGWHAAPATSRLRALGAVLALVAGVLAWFLTRNPQRLRELAEQASRTLVENETRMRHLFEQAPMGLVLLGTNGRIVDCNPTFLDMMGAPRERVIGFNMVADAKDASLAPSIRRALTGERTTLECPYTSTLGDKTGDYRYLFQPIVLRGAITGALVFVEDIAERKAAERELLRAHDELEARVASRTRQLAETNQRLETLVIEREKAGNELREKLHFIQVLLDAIPNPVFYKDRQGRYLGCNQAFAAALGLGEEQIVGKTVYDVAPKDLADRYKEMDEALFTHPPCQVYEESVSVSSGERRSILFNKATFNDAEGNVAGLVGVMVDLTERKREQEKLAEAETMFRSVVEQSLAGIYIIQEGKFVYVNPRQATIFGYTPEEMVGMFPEDLVNEEDKALLRDNVAKRQAGLLPAQRTLYRAVKKDGSQIEVEVHSRLTDYQGKPALIGMLLDITEQRAAERQLNYLAFYDVLTGQPNRTLFLDHLRLAMAGAKRRGAPMALHFLDLDRFKEINDTLGHHTGDLLLKSVAQRLQECVGDTDTVARLGGDEFAVIQTDLPGIEGAEMMAQKIIDTIVQPFTLEGHEVYTSTSIGITVYPLEDANPDQLLKNADMAMYAAKNQGRNNFQFFSGTMNVEAHSRMKLQAGLRQALEHNELLLYYQPKVSLETGLVVGAEALLRWRTADGKLIPPNDFIPVAEESGLIVPIGQWVLETACRQNMAWQQADLAPLRISVNLSPVQFKRNNLIETVTAALRESGLSPQHLELEITESLLMQNDRSTLDALEWLRELGVQVSVDDFGTGYSSLSYLKRLPVDTLKIDRSFIDEIPHNADDVAIARSIISLGHHLNLKIVAEGVETAAQAEFLRAHGCDEVQGYYFAKPVPAEDFQYLLTWGTLP